MSMLFLDLYNSYNGCLVKIYNYKGLYLAYITY